VQINAPFVLRHRVRGNLSIAGQPPWILASFSQSLGGAGAWRGTIRRSCNFMI